MKKFNFFPVLLVALFMFLGLTAKAQTYMPSDKAFTVLDAKLVELEKTYPQVSVSSPATQNNDAFTLHSMKVVVAKSMLGLLKTGDSVSSVLTATFGSINTGNNPSRKAITDEVEAFYIKLFKIK